MNTEQGAGLRPARLVDRSVTEARAVSFFKLKNCYPKNLIGDDDENNFAAFELALDAGHRLVDLYEGAISLSIGGSEGAEVPHLVEYLVSKCWTEKSVHALH